MVQKHDADTNLEDLRLVKAVTSASRATTYIVTPVLTAITALKIKREPILLLNLIPYFYLDQSINEPWRLACADNATRCVPFIKRCWQDPLANMIGTRSFTQRHGWDPGTDTPFNVAIDHYAVFVGRSSECMLRSLLPQHPGLLLAPVLTREGSFVPTGNPFAKIMRDGAAAVAGNKFRDGLGRELGSEAHGIAMREALRALEFTKSSYFALAAMFVYINSVTLQNLTAAAVYKVTSVAAYVPLPGIAANVSAHALSFAPLVGALELAYVLPEHKLATKVGFGWWLGSAGIGARMDFAQVLPLTIALVEIFSPKGLSLAFATGSVISSSVAGLKACTGLTSVWSELFGLTLSMEVADECFRIPNSQFVGAWTLDFAYQTVHEYIRPKFGESKDSWSEADALLLDVTFFSYALGLLPVASPMPALYLGTKVVIEVCEEVYKLLAAAERTEISDMTAFESSVAHDVCPVVEYDLVGL